MRLLLGWMAVVFLCCAAGGPSGTEPDARLVEAQAAIDEALKLQDAGEYAAARRSAELALALREAVLGSAHPDVAKCLNILGTVYLDEGDPAHAKPVLQRALAIREATLGKDHPDVAATLNNLASLYSDQGVYDKARPLLQRALAIWEAALGDQHPHVSAALNNLANLYREQGSYAQAEPLFKRALALREATLGDQHPSVAGSLHDLATLYYEQGSYAQAEPLFKRALALREATLGDQHPHVASSLNTLASLYHDKGLYAQAESLFQRALAIREATLGEQHPQVADSLANLAMVYTDQAAYDKAEPLLQRALVIQEGALGGEHPRVANSLNVLAVLYMVQGLNDKALPLLQRALSINEKALGKTHFNVALSSINLATVYASQSVYDRAETLAKRALAIEEATVGKDHPEVAKTLNSLARIYSAQGKYARADPLFHRACTIVEATLGPEHPDITGPLRNLARSLLAQHRLTEALPLYTRALTVSERRLRQEALVFSEARLATFLRYLREDEQTLYSLLRAHPKDPRVQRLAMSAVLLLKGRSVEESATLFRTLSLSLDAEQHETLEQLRSTRSQQAALSLAGPGPLSPSDYKRLLHSLANTGDSLEAALARGSASLRALTTLPPPAEIVSRVASALPQDSALVEFVAYEDSPLVLEPGASRAPVSHPLRYLALVLLPNASMGAVDLGPAEPIDTAATRLRDALANSEAFQDQAQALYTLAFQPLLKLLGSTRRLWVSPDGQLGLVPFAALHDGQDFLLDSFDVRSLTSGRELLPRPEGVVPSSSVFVLADPKLTTPSPAEPSASGHASPPAPPPDRLERFFSSQAQRLASLSLEALPHARQEAQDIQKLLPQTQLFLGLEATKERLLNLPTPGILHLATHGFFLGDPPSSLGSRGLVQSPGSGPSSQQEPLLNSGLYLADARATASGFFASRPSDIMVTALELAGLNLWGTQLVVLSACDTGRGNVQLGEGIYGLRRALVIAGAETVVMSLWRVNDDSTRLLMESYYRNLLAGQGRASALREAMCALRAVRPEPHDWAPFIVLGSDAPLRDITPLGGTLATPPAPGPPGASGCPRASPR